MSPTHQTRHDDLIVATHRVVDHDADLYRSTIRSVLGAPAADDGRPSPLQAFVLAQPASIEAMRAILHTADDAVHPAIVHIDQRIDIDRLVRCNEELTLSFAVRGARRDSRGIRLCFSISVTDSGGDRIARMDTGVLAIGANHLEGFGTISERVTLPAADDRPPVIAHWNLDRDFVAAYAAAAGDHNPIHLDPTAAHAAGFDDVIVHGMCALALLTELAIDGLGDHRADSIAAVGCRFAAPILAGSSVDAELRTTNEPHLVRASCTTANGPAVKNAWIGLRRGGTP